MKIYAFDFDGTLFDTPDPEIGKPIFKERLDLIGLIEGGGPKGSLLIPRYLKLSQLIGYIVNT